MIHEFRLSPSGSGRGVSCDADGAFIGAVPLLERSDADGTGRWAPRRNDQLSKQLSSSFGIPIEVSSKQGGLKAICNALNDGDVARAQIATVLLAIPEPPPLAKGARSRDAVIKFIRELDWSGLIKADWDPDEHPRWPAGSPDHRGGEFAPTGFWQELGDDISQFAQGTVSQVERIEADESAADLAVNIAAANDIAQGLQDYVNYRAQPWIGSDGKPVQVAFDWPAPAAYSAALEGEELVDPPVAHAATNADWIDPLTSAASLATSGFGAAAESAELGVTVAGPALEAAGPGVGALSEAAAPAAESGVLIGNSGFRSIGEFTDVVTAKYQALYDEGYANTMESVAQGLLPNNPLVIGRETDAVARIGLRDWLNSQQISEGPGEIIQINRRLYDPFGSGDYRIPDVYIPDTQTLLDGSLQFKTGGMAQVRDYQSFSRGAKVTIIRPSGAPDGWAAGSYGIVY